MLLSIAHCVLLQLCAADHWRVKLKNSTFGQFFALLPKLKNVSRNLSVRIILILDATFVPNLTFLGLLNPEILFGEKKLPCHPDKQLHLLHTDEYNVIFYISQNLSNNAGFKL